MQRRHEERLIVAKTQTTIVRFLREGHIFSKLISFTVVKSLVTNGSRLIARCFEFLSFLVILILQVESLGSRLIAE